MKPHVIQLACLFAIAGAFVVELITALSFRRFPVDIRHETCERLQLGMSEKEIEAILGGPAGDYTTQPNCGFYVFVNIGPVCQTPGEDGHISIREWHTDDFAIHVYFNPDGKAVLIASAGASDPPDMRYPWLVRKMRYLILGL